MTDHIVLTGLRVRGHHGVFDFERRDGQDFVVDADLELDTAVAAASDDVADTVHYGELAESLAAVVAGEPVNLLERLVERLVDVCLADARVQRGDCHRAQAAGADPARLRRRRGDDPARAHVSRRGAVDRVEPRRSAGRAAVGGDRSRAGPGRGVVGVRDQAVGARRPARLSQRGRASWPTTRPGRPTGWPGRTSSKPRPSGYVKCAGVRAPSMSTSSTSTGICSDDPVLTLPHPRAAERAFVLVPWFELDPDPAIAALIAALPAGRARLGPSGPRAVAAMSQ